MAIETLHLLTATCVIQYFNNAPFTYVASTSYQTDDTSIECT